MSSIKDCWCYYCGHPVLAADIAIDPEDDYDRGGKNRDRCADTACVSAAVATYAARAVLVVVDDAHEARREVLLADKRAECEAYDRARRK